VGVLVVAAVIDAAVVCALAAVPLVGAGQVVVLYALLALQFSAAAFYEPGESQNRMKLHWLSCCSMASATVRRHQCRCSLHHALPLASSTPVMLLDIADPLPLPVPTAARKALVPVLVPADQLHLATTIDR